MYFIDASKEDFVCGIPRMQQIMRTHTCLFCHDEVYICLSENNTSKDIVDAIRICSTNFFLGVGFQPVPQPFEQSELETCGFVHMISHLSFIAIGVFDGESFAIIHAEGA